MTDLNYLRAKATIHGYDTLQSIYDLLGITRNTFYKRANESLFTVQDIRIMAKAFHLTMQDTWNIFICGMDNDSNFKRSTNKRSVRQ